VNGSGNRAFAGRMALDWLLESDPAIRWQALRDLTDAPAEVVTAERAKVATEGWGAELLARQSANGQWGGDRSIQEWTASPEWHALMSLVQLHELGLDPQSPPARRAAELTANGVSWQWWGENPFFVGEVEPCINGRVVAVGAHFGQDVSGLVDRLLGEQMADGGWNCEQENGSVRGSFDTTINVLEGLLEYGRASGGSDALHEARRRGEDFLLERRLMRRLSTGEIADPAFLRLAYPYSWHYDILRALDYLRAAGWEADERAAEAVEVVESKRGEGGRWLLEARHEDVLDFDMTEHVGQPSRWITLRAMRVLQHYRHEARSA
jgi:hypothetical protein